MNGQTVFYGVLAVLASAGIVFLILLSWAMARLSAWLDEQDRRLRIQSRNERK